MASDGQATASPGGWEARIARHDVIASLDMTQQTPAQVMTVKRTSDLSKQDNSISENKVLSSTAVIDYCASPSYPPITKAIRSCYR